MCTEVCQQFFHQILVIIHLVLIFNFQTPSFFLPQSISIRSVRGESRTRSAAVTRFGPREGGMCGYELSGPLYGAERPHSHRTHHL